MPKLIKKLLDPKLSLVLAVIYTLALLLLSLISLQGLPQAEVENADKIFHTLAYAGLTFLWYLQYFSRSTRNKKRLKKKPLLLICLAIVLFGIFIEVLQESITAYRTFDVWDITANFLGTLLALMVILALEPKLEKVKKKL